MIQINGLLFFFGIILMNVAWSIETDLGNKLIGAFGFILILIGLSLSSDYPKAIDVYRGSTELNITYKIVGKDTIPVDSVVIYKYI